VVNFTPPVALSSVQKPGYPLQRALGGLHSQTGRAGEYKNPLSPQGFEPRIPQSVSYSIQRRH